MQKSKIQNSEKIGHFKRRILWLIAKRTLELIIPCPGYEKTAVHICTYCTRR